MSAACDLQMLPAMLLLQSKPCRGAAACAGAEAQSLCRQPDGYNTSCAMEGTTRASTAKSVAK